MTSAIDPPRSASASIPPEAEIVRVVAYGIAATFDVKVVKDVFDGAERVVESKTEIAAFYSKSPGSKKCAFIHDFGAIVFFEFSEEEQKRVLAKLFERIGAPPRAPLVDEFMVVVAPLTGDAALASVDAQRLGLATLASSRRPIARFDRLIVTEYSTALAEIVSIVVGQSVGMEYYEDDVTAILGRIEGLTREFADRGAFRGKMRDLTRFIGEAMHLRNEVIQTLALLDTPSSTWDDESLDRAYRELKTAFAIEDRYRALDQKLAMIRDSLELILDVARHRTSLVVEVGVAVLILVEVILFVVEMVRR